MVGTKLWSRLRKRREAVKAQTPKLEKPNWREVQVSAARFQAQQAREVAKRRELNPDLSHVPSLGEYVPQPIVDPLAHVPPEDREEYRRREEIARRETAEKMKKVAPLYNKGGPQYIGDDPQLVGSVASGTNRRRS